MAHVQFPLASPLHGAQSTAVRDTVSRVYLNSGDFSRCCVARWTPRYLPRTALVSPEWVSIFPQSYVEEIRMVKALHRPAMDDGALPCPFVSLHM